MSGKMIIWLSSALALLVAATFTFSLVVVLGKVETAPQIILLEAKAGKFNAVNPTLQVQRGIPVEITVRNAEPGAIPHNFVLTGLDVRTPKHLLPGESTSLRFTPTRSGEFAYSCTLHPGLMDGRLIVRP